MRCAVMGWAACPSTDTAALWRIWKYRAGLMWNLTRIASSFRDDHRGHSPSNASSSAGVGMGNMQHPTPDIQRKMNT